MMSNHYKTLQPGSAQGPSAANRMYPERNMERIHIISKWQIVSVFAILFFLGISLQTYAQSRTVSGTVTAQEDNSALPGVNITVKGTTTGTVTDASGAYSLSVPDNNTTLVFSYIGYKTQEIAVGTRSTIDLALTADISSLEEVVVVGYGTQKKADLTGSVAVVDVAQVLQRPAADVGNMLQGRVAGVMASGSNQPGGNGFIRIRGFNSFGNNNPLFIVDGVQTGDLNTLNPNDIESIQVLKDGSSAAIYGARAANGVVIITTKKGKAGKTNISYNGFVGTGRVLAYPDLANTQQLGEILWRQYAGANNGAGMDPNHGQYGRGAQPQIPDYALAGSSGGLFEGDPKVDPSLYNYNREGFYQIARANKEGTDWFAEITRPTLIQDHNISASGGTERSRYMFSAGYFEEKGALKHTFYNRYTARLNSEFDLTKNIRFGETLLASHRKNLGSGDNDEGSPWAQAYRMQPIVPVYDIMGNFAGSKAPNTGNGQNPLAQLYRARDNNNATVRFLGSIYGEANFLKMFRFRSQFGMDYNNFYNFFFNNINPEHSEGGFNTGYGVRSGYGYTWTFTNTLNWEKVFGLHDVKLLAGTEAVENRFEQVGGDRNGYYPFTTPDFWTLNLGSEVGLTNFSDRSFWALTSYFGRLDYTFANKYLLNATLRRDGSSRFAEAVRYGYFPSVSVGWRISDEGFMDAVPFVSDLKLRAGYGVVGSDQIDANNQFSTFQRNPQRSFYDIGGTNTTPRPGFDFNRLGNQRTKWEETATINAGMDVTLFDGLLELTLDVYDKQTRDLLVRIVRPATEGDFTAPFLNVGTVSNRGLDALLTYRGKALSDQLSYNVSLNFSHYRNKVTSSGVDFFTSGTRYGNVSRTITGQPFGQFFGYVRDGFFQDEGEVANSPEQPGKGVGKWRWKDLNGDNVINADDRTFLGTPHPDFTSGINFDLAYKNFDLSMFFFWNYGNQIYNNVKWFTDFNGFQGNRSVKMLTDSWTPENPNASLPVLDINDSFSNNRPHDYYVEPGSYFRAKTMQLGYRLPAGILSKVGASNVRVYVQGQNLFTITKYSGPDPDLIDVGRGDLGLGVDYGRIPGQRQFLIGLNVGF